MSKDKVPKGYQLTQPATVQVVRDVAPHLRQIIALARANKETLGLMPDQALIEAARKGNILVNSSPLWTRKGRQKS